MRILAIDPGPIQSAYVLLDSESFVILNHRTMMNPDLAAQLSLGFDEGEPEADHLAIEMIASYGMSVGASVFETCVWIGRFVEAWHRDFTLVYRHQVKIALCHDSRAKDTNIRAALIDLYPATGGGSRPQIGTAKEPGPLRGIVGDEWSALAVGVTWARSQLEKGGVE